MTALRDMLAKLKLTVNETKTRLCRWPEETFDFLGYTSGRCYSPQTGRAYLGTHPSAQNVRKLVADISSRTARRTTWQEPGDVVGLLNRKLVGWSNYFCLGPVRKTYDLMNRHACQRLRQWLCRKYRVAGQGFHPFSDQHLHEDLGLLDLRAHRRRFLCANA